jgi:23S rRNA (pseudouridine1915-N3)-methyltransferase
VQLRILAIGKLKQPGLEALVAEYQQRARTLIPIELIHLRDLASLRARARRPRVVLDERGSQVDSEGLAKWIADWRGRGEGRIDWLIGDAHGFEDADRDGADRVLSLSKLTLPHRIAQLMLVEQLYRAGTILVGHPYHHG